jgi:hypothetical protein
MAGPLMTMMRTVKAVVLPVSADGFAELSVSTLMVRST